jgi:hypothetical protein
MKLWVIVVVGFLASDCELAIAADPDAILSKESARDVFSLSKSQWEENAKAVKRAGLGNYKIALSGQYTLQMRPAPGAGLLLVTPHYRHSNPNEPWKISVSVAADQEPSLSLYKTL